MTPFDCLYAAALPLLGAILLPDRRRFGELSNLLLRLVCPPRYSRADVLLHAVSVGEVRVAAAIAEALQHLHISPLITTTTRRGLQTAQKTGLNHAPAPPDFSSAVNRMLRLVSPKTLVLVELELWPNLILSASRRCRIVIANGRITESAFMRYQAFKPLLTPIIRRVDLVLAQNHLYAERFERLGFPTVKPVGNIKYDAAPKPPAPTQKTEIRSELNIPQDAFVVVGGSTYLVEEHALVEACKEQIKSGLRLVLAPRQADHFDALESLLRKEGLRYVRRSAKTDTPWDVLIVDTVGELVRIYGAADLAYVGGTLFEGKGGHNVIEPAGLGVGVLCGPHFENFKDAVTMLQAAGGLRVVRDAKDLKTFIRELFTQRSKTAQMGKSAAKAVDLARGATERTASFIAAFTSAGSSSPSC